MSDHKLASIWHTQKSLTEWLEDIKHKDAALIRREDNDKRERLKILNRLIGLPFDKPVQFDGSDLANKTPDLEKYLKEYGTELCALRLMPKEEGLPKLRMRGKSVADAYKWFEEQDIDASKYKADFVPHSEKNYWGTIFVVNKHGIQGEIIAGGHHQLTQGFHETATPNVFRFDYKTWEILPKNDKALSHLKKLADFLHVPDRDMQNKLANKLGATFAKDYLEGYFESTDSDAGTWFIDYSQGLGKMYEDTVFRTTKNKGLVSGQTGCAGTAKGKVCIVDAEDIDKHFPVGSVLVCKVTTPAFVPLMKRAVAIVTDQGGILSHAAIVARELKVPCIVGTGNATQILKNGQLISVDATTGTVKVL